MRVDNITTENGILPRKAFTVNETAIIIGVCPMTILRLISRGKLRASNAVRHKLIPAKEIDRFLEETTESAGGKS